MRLTRDAERLAMELYDLGQSRMGFEHSTFRLRGERSNRRLRHRGGLKSKITILIHWHNIAFGNAEIKHALSCLLQNNFRGGEMLFEIENPRR